MWLARRDVRLALLSLVHHIWFTTRRTKLVTELSGQHIPPYILILLAIIDEIPWRMQMSNSI